MSNPSKETPGKIHALTSLRFFAAFYVVLFHTIGARFNTGTFPSLVLQAASFGYISVSFFFLLSGYILAVVYLKDSRPVQRSRFYKARFARIYPLFLITLLADAPFVFNINAEQFGVRRAALKTTATLGAHILMLQAWLPGLHGIDPPNWSLSVETLFYLVFPIVGALLWKLSGRRLWLTASGIWFVSQVAAIEVSPHVRATTAKFHPLLHVGTFVLGILLARWQYSSNAEVSERKDRKIESLIMLAAVAALATVVRWGSFLPVPNLNAGLLSPVYAMMIWACSSGENLFVRMLRTRWLVLLGEASFGLYLIHMPVLHLFEQLGWATNLAMLPMYLFSIVALSVLSFYWIEAPSQRWILRRLHTASKETIEAASDAQ